MFRALRAAVLFTGALALGAFLGTTDSVSRAHADVVDERQREEPEHEAAERGARPLGQRELARHASDRVDQRVERAHDQG